jgi:signal transduction histidine kinase
VLLNRLRMRGKLAVLVAIPLAVVVALSLVFAIGRVQRANVASDTARAVTATGQIGGVVAELQQERLVSIGFLRGVASATSVTLQHAAVGDRIADLESTLGGGVSPALRAALDSVASLDPLRTQITAGSASTNDVITQFGARISAILDAMRVIDGVDVGTPAGREVVALDALVRLNELRNAGASMLVATAGLNDQAAIIGYAGIEAAVPQVQSRFTLYATPAQTTLYNQLAQAYDARTGNSFPQAFAADPVAAVSAAPVAQIYPAMASFVQLGRSVETKIATDVTSTVNAARNRDLRDAYLAGGFVLLMIVLVAALSVVVARSMSKSLRALTDLAVRVGVLTEAELRRVADDDAESVEPIAFEPVNIGAKDEFSELAEAFTLVQRSAAALVERQAQSRRNVAQMFGSVGRRTQNLVGRQLAIIDGLTLDEPDSDRLRELFRLDHVTSRLRRNASSLVVLSGAADEGAYFAPLPLADVIRNALGEIEDDTRVDIDVPVNTSVRPAIINDVLLLLAELIENATSFSPPHTRVLVAAEVGSTVVSVIDEGIGMTAEQLDAENGRLTSRERLDLAPTEVLGLLVVGRLARRHGLKVALAETEGGGVTVTVDLGSYAMQTGRVDSPLYSGRALGRAAIKSDRPPAPRPTMWPEPMALAAVPFDIAKLEHATKVLESGAPWNAFEVRPALDDQPWHGPRPAPADQPWPSWSPSRPDSPAPVEAPVSAGAVATDQTYDSGATTISLARRVPGATAVSEPQPFFVPTAPPRPLDAARARDLVEQFEFGVAQALRETGPSGEGRPNDETPGHRDQGDTP